MSDKGQINDYFNICTTKFQQLMHSEIIFALHNKGTKYI